MACHVAKRKEPITGIGRARPSCAQIRVIQSPRSHGCADVARCGVSRRIRMGPNGSHHAATWLATDPLKRKEPDHWATSTRWLQHDSDGVELTFEDLPLCDRCYEHRLMERFNELHFMNCSMMRPRQNISHLFPVRLFSSVLSGSSTG